MADPVAPSQPVDLAHLGRLAADLIARREVGASISAFHQATGAGEDGLVYAVQTRRQAERAWTAANPEQQLLVLLEALRGYREWLAQQAHTVITTGRGDFDYGGAEPDVHRGRREMAAEALARLDAAVRVEE